MNNELQILKKTGCYADFTFPSINEANPRQINCIYYEIDDPDKPKSHNTGRRVKKDGAETGDLMMIQGPLHPFLFSEKISSLRYVNDAIDGDPIVTGKRIDAWIKTGIHVEGKRNWVFVKNHTHGIMRSDAALGKDVERIFSHLETRYNDGKEYILHYVTAREAYNIIKAVESGKNYSDPEKYRDFLIEKPKYDSSPRIPEASDYLKSLIDKACSS